MGLTNLGIFHTAIGVIALLAAIISYVRFAKIDLHHSTGKIYFFGTVITSLTALGISKHGGFNPGHVFSILILLLALIAYWLKAKRPGNTRARYFENFLLTLTFFFSWLPTVNETFTRVPVGHPLAQDIKDPIIAKTILFLFILFIVGSICQIRVQRKRNVGLQPGKAYIRS